MVNVLKFGNVRTDSLLVAFRKAVEAATEIAPDSHNEWPIYGATKREIDAYAWTSWSDRDAVVKAFGILAEYEAKRG